MIAPGGFAGNAEFGQVFQGRGDGRRAERCSSLAPRLQPHADEDVRGKKRSILRQRGDGSLAESRKKLGAFLTVLERYVARTSRSGDDLLLEIHH